MDQAWIPLLLSLKVAGWATAIDVVLGVAVAFGLSRWRSSARELVDSLLTLPLVMPPTVLGYYLLVLLGRRGVIGGRRHSPPASSTPIARSSRRGPRR